MIRAVLFCQTFEIEPRIVQLISWKYVFPPDVKKLI